MIIPSIYLPIDIKLFDFHFNTFFLDYTQTKPDFYKFILNRIEIGTVGIRYEIGLESQKASDPPIPNRAISEIEALIIGDNRIEIRAAALDISDLPNANNNWGWGEAFLWQFYNMIDSKWNVKLLIPGIEGVDDMPLLAARAKFDRDFGIREVWQRLKEISSDDNVGNDVIKEDKTPLPGSEAEMLCKKIDEYYNLLAQGLHPIEAINEAPQRSTKRGPVTPTDDEKLKALRDWDNRKGHDQYLDEFLEKRFGTENGVLKVAPSTFHGWRRKLKRKG